MKSATLDPPTASDLYRAHGPSLRAFVRSRVRDAALAEDLCQETFVAAIAQGVPDEGRGRWLFGIARNKVRMHLRDRKPTAAPTDPPSRGVGPLEALSRDERSTHVRQAVDALPGDLREVIVLRYQGGLDYAGIADRLDVPLSTIQGRLKRARRALSKALREEAQ